MSRFVRLPHWFGVLAALLACVALAPWASSKAEAAVACSSFNGISGGGAYDAPAAQCTGDANWTTATFGCSIGPL